MAELAAQVTAVQLELQQIQERISSEAAAVTATLKACEQAQAGYVW